MGITDGIRVEIGDEEGQPFLRNDSSFNRPRKTRWTNTKLITLPVQLSKVLISHLSPSFLSQKTAASLRTPTAPENTIEAHLPTAWLDGLRGWASLFVFNFHFTYAYYHWTQHAYGSPDVINPLSLPFIRLLWSGPSAVSVFFIVSGFSLAWGPLKELMLPKESGAAGLEEGRRRCLTRLASGTFRRFLRLFLPVMIASGMVAICLQLGLYTPGEYSSRGFMHLGWHEPAPKMANTPWEQYVHYSEKIRHFVNAFADVNAVDYEYDCHLWTIPAEFRFSLCVFLLVAAMTRARLSMRYLMLVGMIVYCYFMEGWIMLLFTAGLLIAQMHIHNAKKEANRFDRMPMSEKDSTGEVQQSGLRRFGRFFLATLGLFLLSSPEFNIGETPYYYYMWHYFTPESWGGARWRFPHVVGSIMLVYAASRSKTLQKLLSCPLSRYFGKISYALYLCHGPMNHMLGYWLIPKIWTLTGGPTQSHIELVDGIDPNPGRKFEGGTNVGKDMGFVFGAMIVIPMTIWVADIFTRQVDERVVRFAKWTEKIVE